MSWCEDITWCFHFATWEKKKEKGFTWLGKAECKSPLSEDRVRKWHSKTDNVSNKTKQKKLIWADRCCSSHHRHEIDLPYCPSLLCQSSSKWYIDSSQLQKLSWLLSCRWFWVAIESSLECHAEEVWVKRSKRTSSRHHELHTNVDSIWASKGMNRRKSCKHYRSISWWKQANREQS